MNAITECICNFPALITGVCVHVDETARLCESANQGAKFAALPVTAFAKIPPRAFGESKDETARG